MNYSDLTNTTGFDIDFAHLSDLSVDNNITVGGTIDGVDLSVFKTDYDSEVNQDVRTTASPTFEAVKVSSSTPPVFLELTSSLTFKV